MRAIYSIFSREFKSYFISPIAYVVTSIFLIINGYFFYTYLTGFLTMAIQTTMEAQQMRQLPPNLNVNMLVIQPLFHNFSTVSIFIVPMITMRLFSEERKSMTIELLLTSPITTFQIVFGKFFAALFLFLAMIIPTTIFFVILAMYGEPEILPIVTGYIGIIMLGSVFLSVGILISSTTENQIIAGVFSFGLFLLLWVIGWVAHYAGPGWNEFLGYMSLINHYDDFTRGILDSQHIVFYCSFLFLGLYLTHRSIESIRWRG